MKTVLALIVTSLAVLAMLTGCGGGSASSLSAKDKQAFDQATPELKQAWEKVLAADKANDYVTAQSTLQSLTASKLTPEQEQAVNKESAAVSQRLLTAAEKGDPAAVKAMQELRSGRR